MVNHSPHLTRTMTILAQAVLWHSKVRGGMHPAMIAISMDCTSMGHIKRMPLELTGDHSGDIITSKDTLQ